MKIKRDLFALFGCMLAFTNLVVGSEEHEIKSSEPCQAQNEQFTNLTAEAADGKNGRHGQKRTAGKDGEDGEKGQDSVYGNGGNGGNGGDAD